MYMPLQQPPPFQSTADPKKWKIWKRDFEVFLCAIGYKTKSQEEQINLLLHCIGEDGRNTYDSFDWALVEVKSYENVLRKFDEYYIPLENDTVETHIFNSRVQKPEETFDSFLQEIKRLSLSCDFGDQREKTLKQRIIQGVNSGTLREKLLSKKDLTLSKAIEICRLFEVNQKHLATLEKKASTETIGTVQHPAGVTNQRISSQRQARRDNRRNCHKCDSRHPYGNCPAYGHKCLNCGRENHFDKCCNFKNSNNFNFDRDANRSRNSAYNRVRQNQSRESSFDRSRRDYSNNNVGENFNGNRETGSRSTDTQRNSSSRNSENLAREERSMDRPGIRGIEASSFDGFCGQVTATGSENSSKGYYWEIIKINGEDLSIRLDSGADKDVMPLYVFKNLNLPEELIKEPPTGLANYDGSPIDVVGVCDLECLFRSGKKHLINFYIVNSKEGTRPVLGGPTLLALNLLVKVDVVTNSGDEKVEEHWAFKENQELFEGIGDIKDPPLKIKLKKNAQGVVSFSHRVPFSLMDPFKEQLEIMEKEKIIVKVSEPTEWVNPVILVKKPDNTIRVCLDPGNLNGVILREHYQLPNFEEISAKFKNSKIFSSLDANKGFYQIRLDEESSKLTTFITPFGRYRFKRLPFGISSAPEIFHKIFNQIFEGIDGIEIFIDDILIHASDQKSHDAILQQVLERAKQWGVRFNRHKCKFNLNEIKFLGHIINEHGIQPDPSKVLAIKNLKTPQNVNELETFLGLITYLSKFIKNLSEKTFCLRELTKNGIEFIWTSEHAQVFQELKDQISTETLLIFYDPQKELKLSVDCSQHSMGATLMQEEKPLAYASKALSETQERYAQIEKEALAILFGCERFHQYVYGRVVEIETDHKPLVTIFKKPLDSMSPRLQRIRIRLLNYSFNLYYKQGSELYVADCLSRNVEDVDSFEFLELGVNVLGENKVNVLDTIIQKQVDLLFEADKLLDLELIKVELKKDSQMEILKKLIIEGWPNQKTQVPDSVRVYFGYRDEMAIIDELIFKGKQMVIPKTLRSLMLRRLHYPHLGIVKTKLRARDTCFWPQINSQIEDYVSSCSTCQLNSSQNQKEEFLNRELPKRAWQMLGSDLFHLQQKNFLIVVDYFSKYPEIFELKKIDSPSVIVALKSIFSRHGVPEIFYSDNGGQYDSNALRAFAKEWGFEFVTSSPEYPQSNGQAERTIQTIKNLLKKCVSDNTDPYLALLEYRNTPISSEIPSPAELLFNRKAKGLLPFLGEAYEPRIFADAYSNLAEKKEEDIFRYDLTARPETSFEIGQRVLVRKHDRWNIGKIVKKASRPRSYNVELDSGGIIERTSRHIKLFRERDENLENKNDEETLDRGLDLAESTVENVEDGINESFQAGTEQVAVNNPKESPIRVKTRREIKLPKRFDGFLVNK